MRAWQSILCFVVLLAPLREARAVVYRFDSPAELDDWVIVDSNGKPQTWAVERGVLSITSASDGFETRDIDGLLASQGTLSWRMKIKNVRPDDMVEIGVVFRVQPDPAPDGHPAQYVYLSVNGGLGDGFLYWHSVFVWGCKDDNDLPPAVGPCRPGLGRAPGVGGGRRALIPGWDGVPVGSWINGRIEFRDGAHEIYLGIDEPPQRIMTADEVRAATTGGWPGLHERKTVAEWIAEGHPNFGIGGVGILAQLGTGAANAKMEVVFDDFKVDVVRTVSPRGRLATTWGALRATVR